ncbi:CHAP domain-containing protein [Acrocarpospora sp. B8E8]|uniref:CHAP domain-containing protein n=1 Tax=Acrocarpospora sp. B8E8 TaxID=3153572 RepID=UPI00325DFBE3
MSGAAMVARARKDLGLSGRPNRITRSYAKRNGREFLAAPWCDQGVTEWARDSGNTDAVLPEGDRAYTVWHAEDGRGLKRWHAGTAANIKAHAEPGAIIFFDWDGTDSIGRIDHVGIVEKNLGDGRVQTIEANTGDACKRRVRAANVIAGFWNPPYEEVDDMPSPKEYADAVYERFSQTLDKDLWAVREGIFAAGDKIDPRTALRQIWAYTKDGYAADRTLIAAVDEISTRLDAQQATIRTLAEALASRDEAIDADAVVRRIETAISNLTVRLEVAE